MILGLISQFSDNYLGKSHRGSLPFILVTLGIMDDISFQQPPCHAAKGDPRFPTTWIVAGCLRHDFVYVRLNYSKV